jgi:hypothetical protein
VEGLVCFVYGPMGVYGEYGNGTSGSADPSGRAKVWVRDRSLAGIVGSNFADEMDVCFL